MVRECSRTALSALCNIDCINRVLILNVFNVIEGFLQILIYAHIKWQIICSKNVLNKFNLIHFLISKQFLEYTSYDIYMRRNKDVLVVYNFGFNKNFLLEYYFLSFSDAYRPCSRVCLYYSIIYYYDLKVNCYCSDTRKTWIKGYENVQNNDHFDRKHIRYKQENLCH